MEHGEEGLNEIFQYETLYEKSKNDEAKLYLDELNKIKTELILEQPLFSHLLSTFQIMVVEKKLAKFAIDKIYFYFSESYIAELINERDHWKGKIKGDLLHMIMHIIYRHYEREEKFDSKVWGIASDIVVFNALWDIQGRFEEKNMWELHDMSKIPKSLLNKSVEDTYIGLLNYFEDNEEDKLGRNIEDNEEDNENEKQNDLLDIESYSFQNNIDTISQILGTEDLNCDIETLMGLNGNMDKIQYADEFNEGIVFEKYDNLLKRGNMDDNVKKWVEKYFNLRIDWTTELKNYIQKLLPYDMNWSSPNRKMLGQGIYLPSMLKENIKIILAFDTSGSINEENLKLFLNETQNIIQSINNLELIVIDCDSKIQKISNYKSGENVLDHIFLGGGGTDFRPVFQYAESIEPNLVIYFTDGDGVIPTDNYQFDTIWMIINDNKMPFGNVINMI